MDAGMQQTMLNIGIHQELIYAVNVMRQQMIDILWKMFRGKKAHSSSTHIFIGFAVLFVLYILNQKYLWVDIKSLSYIQILFILFITWVYSQMPDIDLPNSRIARYANIFGLWVIIYSFASKTAAIGIWTAIILIVFKLVQHRTVVHSLIAGIIISSPLYLLNPLYSIIALAMFLAHIISEGEFSVWSEKDWKVFGK